MRHGEIELGGNPVESLKTKLRDEERKASQIEAEAIRLRQLADELRQHSSNLEAKIDGQDAAIRRLGARNAELGNEAHEHASALTRERLEAAEQLNQINSKLVWYDDELKKREQAIGQLQAETEHRSHAHAIALAAANEQLAGVNEQLADQLKRMVSWQEAQKALDQKAAEVTRDLAVSEARRSMLEAENGALRSDLQLGQAALEGQRQILLMEREAWQSSIAALRSSNSWRVTAVARAASRSAARIAHLVRRSSTSPGQPAHQLRAAAPQQEQNADSISAAREPNREVSVVAAPATIETLAADEVAAVTDAQTQEALSCADVPDTCEDFDPAYYLRRYPDVSRAGLDPHEHYQSHGKIEGRAGRPPELILQENQGSYRADRATVLVVSHEATRTGAPVLAWNVCRQLRANYNVVVLLLGGGELEDYFAQACDVLVGPYSPSERDVASLAPIIDAVRERYKPRLAIVNSIASRSVLPTLARNSIPSILLVHEFFRFHCSEDELVESMRWAGRTVFSARLVRNHADIERTRPAARLAPIIAQGKSEIPAPRREQKTSHPLARLRSERGTEPFVVLGAGTIEYRKGIDLFIATAAEVRRKDPDAEVLFVWVGSETPMHREYASFIREQALTAGLGSSFRFLPASPDLESAYEHADVFFLASRLDPLPNVAIDAMTAGLPVLCFEHATGLVELLSDDPVAASCIVPLHAIDEAAQQILAWHQQPALHATMAKRMRDLAGQKFSMSRYVDELLELGTRLSDSVKQQQSDIEVLMRGDEFQESYYLLPGSDTARSEAILEYVKGSESGIFARKALPGFDPLVYAEEAMAGASGNPLVHYLTAGKPDGKWQLPVIGPRSNVGLLSPDLRIGVHIHAYYPEMLGEIFDRLVANDFNFDVLVSVCSEGAKEIVQSRISRFSRGRSHVRVVPNVGRDIGPMLMAFKDLLGDYDLIGHFHTKKSSHVTIEDLVPNWINFLMTNLLGSSEDPRARAILGEFVRRPDLGMVFPDDPNSIGWDLNREHAEVLAARMGISELPPQFFSFPTGTMFWARPRALLPIIDLGLTEQDFPPEPVPIDGTMLHAIERLLPAVVRHAGYTVAVCHLPGVTR